MFGSCFGPFDGSLVGGGFSMPTNVASFNVALIPGTSPIFVLCRLQRGGAVKREEKGPIDLVSCAGVGQDSVWGGQRLPRRDCIFWRVAKRWRSLLTPATRSGSRAHFEFWCMGWTTRLFMGQGWVALTKVVSLWHCVQNIFSFFPRGLGSGCAAVWCVCGDQWTQCAQFESCQAAFGCGNFPIVPVGRKARGAMRASAPPLPPRRRC